MGLVKRRLFCIQTSLQATVQQLTLPPEQRPLSSTSLYGTATNQNKATGTTAMGLMISSTDPNIQNLAQSILDLAIVVADILEMIESIPVSSGEWSKLNTGD
jgi:hypothetical protein